MPKPLAKLGAGYDVELSPDGSLLCVMPSTAPARLYRTSDWSLIGTLGDLKYPRHAWFLDASGLIAVSSIENKVAVFDTRDGHLVAAVRTRHGERDAVCVAPDEKTLIASTSARQAKHGETCLDIYSLKTGKRVASHVVCKDQFSLHGASNAVFTANGHHLILAWGRWGEPHDGYYVSVYEWPSFKQKHTVQLDAGIQPSRLFQSSRANSVLLAAGAARSFSPTRLSEFSAPSLKQTIIWNDESPDEQVASGFNVSTCRRYFQYFHRSRVEIFKLRGANPIGCVDLGSDIDEIYSTAFLSNSNQIAIGTGATHVWDVQEIAE